jgi:hypothetical protein
LISRPKYQITVHHKKYRLHELCFSSRERMSFRPEEMVEHYITSFFGQLQAGQLLFLHGVLHCFKNRQLLPASTVAKVSVTCCAHSARPTILSHKVLLLDPSSSSPVAETPFLFLSLQKPPYSATPASRRLGAMRWCLPTLTYNAKGNAARYICVLWYVCMSRLLLYAYVG